MEPAAPGWPDAFPTFASVATFLIVAIATFLATRPHDGSPIASGSATPPSTPAPGDPTTAGDPTAPLAPSAAPPDLSASFSRLAVAGLALFAAGLALFAAAAWIDPDRRYMDEEIYRLQAEILAQGALCLRDLPLARFADAPFLLAREQCYTGAFPPGWPLVLALGVLLDLPTLVNPLLSGAAVVLVGVLASRLAAGAGVPPRRAAVVAAFLLAVNPWLAWQAASGFSHVATLAWTLLALVLWRGPTRPLTGVVMGLAAGMVVVTRPLDGVLLCGGLGASLLLRRDARGLLWFGLGAAGPGAFLAVYNLVVTGGVTEFGAAVYARATSPVPECHRLGWGEDVGCPLDHGARWPGFWPRDSVEVTWARLRSLSASVSGHAAWIVPGLAALGVAAWRRLPVWPLAGYLGSLVLAYGLFYYHGIAYGPRFLFVALALAAPVALVAVDRRHRASRGLQAAVMASALAGLVQAAERREPWVSGNRSVSDIDAARSALAAVPGAVLLTHASDHVLHAIDAASLAHGTPAVLGGSEAEGFTLRLLLPSTPIFVLRDGRAAPLSERTAPPWNLPFASYWPFWDKSGDPCELVADGRGTRVACAFDAPGDHVGITQPLPEGCWRLGVLLDPIESPAHVVALVGEGGGAHDLGAGVSGEARWLPLGEVRLSETTFVPLVFETRTPGRFSPLALGVMPCTMPP